MLFLTYWFVLFACVAFPLYWLVPVRSVRLAVLLTSCAVFHTHFAGPAGVLPIAALAVLTYAAGLTRRRSLCGLVIAACVLAEAGSSKPAGWSLLATGPPMGPEIPKKIKTPMSIHQG